jgi:paraquat-inducible protein B
MSEKTHTVALGAFVIGAILIAITIVIFAVGSGIGQSREKVVMVFDGSVKGLVVGAPVALRGVQIGQVTNLELRLDSDKIALIMVVEAEISTKNIKRLGKNTEDITDELIARGLRAQLKTQSLLTGLLYIQLDFHPEQPAHFVTLDSKYLQIPTIPTGLELLTRQFEDLDLGSLVKKIESTVNGMNQLATNQAVQELPADMHSTLTALTALSEQLHNQLAVSGPKLDAVMDNAATTLEITNTELPALAAGLKKNLELLDTAIAALEQTMVNVDSMVAPGSATTYQLNTALQDLSAAGRAIRQLADTLNRQPEALLRGKRENSQ